MGMEDSFDALGRQYAELAEQARLARSRYTELLLDPDTTDDELEDADRDAHEAERSRDRVARQLRTARNRLLHGEPSTPDTGSAAADAAGPSRTRATRGPDPGARGQRVDALLDLGQQLRDAPLQMGRRRPVQHALVGETLSLFGAPLRGPELSVHVQLLTGEPLTSAQLTQMRREERRRYDTGADRPELARPWYVTPCISGETLTPATGTYSLSTWALVDRMVSRHSPRLWAARAAANVAAALLPLGHGQFVIGHQQAERDRQGTLIAILTRLLRGNEWGRTGTLVDVEQVAADADTEASALADQHAQDVSAALDQLDAVAARAPEVRLWGVPRPEQVRGEGGA